MITKTLSVSMPNYNDSAYIGNALRAICEQSFSPKEVVVVDDGSTDDSIEVIEELAAQYPCIRLVRNEVNQGVNYSQNRAASLTSGDYIYLASANDLVLPDFFEKSMSLLANYPQSGLCCTDSREIRVRGGRVQDQLLGWLPESGYVSPMELVKISQMIHPLTIGAPSSIIRRDLLPPHQVLIPELESFADWFLCQVTALRHGCCYVPEVLVAVNLMENSHSSTDQNCRTRYERACIRLFQLLASRDFEDITPIVIQCRALHIVNPWGKNPCVVFKALCTPNTGNKHTHELFWHLVVNYICYLLPDYVLSSPQRIRSITQLIVERLVKRLLRQISQKLHDTYVTIRSFLQNMYDRAYARTFHKYDRLRSVIRKKLETTHNKSVLLIKKLVRY